MRFKIIIASLLAMFYCGYLGAQERPLVLDNVEIADLDGNATHIPHWGETNLVIFYIDPDRRTLNSEFAQMLRRDYANHNKDLQCMGIMNLKDAPMIPNALVRKVAKRREASDGTPIFADKERLIAKSWGLGDCNNTIVTIIIDKRGELVYLRKGVLADDDIELFCEIIDSY